jgi:L-threonylcarbamoyladenylate synthase
MRRVVLDPEQYRPADLDPVVAWLRGGGLVVYPTDTFYAVAADPTSATAIESLYDWKGRAAEAALPLIAADVEQVADWFGALEGPSARLAARFWPGPLSLLLPAGGRIAAVVHAGSGSVAVRVPRHPVARALAAAWGGPLPATSANRSGHPAASRVDAIGPGVSDRRVLVVDAGATAGGAASTIIDARVAPPRLVRAGVVPWSRVLESIDT